MTPTLFGRLQTRVVVTLVVGGLWTLLVTPILPGGAAGRFGMTFLILATVAGLGVGWELVYHGLQQFRWEKDWPTMLGLVTALNEGVAVWLVLNLADRDVPGSAFLVHLVTTWLVIWIFVSGPIRVLFPRWRFRGGRFV